MEQMDAALGWKETAPGKVGSRRLPASQVEVSVSTRGWTRSPSSGMNFQVYTEQEVPLAGYRASITSPKSLSQVTSTVSTTWLGPGVQKPSTQGVS